MAETGVKDGPGVATSMVVVVVENRDFAENGVKDRSGVTIIRSMIVVAAENRFFFLQKKEAVTAATVDSPTGASKTIYSLRGKPRHAQARVQVAGGRFEGLPRGAFSAPFYP